jgi:dienelactone hydrolase
MPSGPSHWHEFWSERNEVGDGGSEAFRYLIDKRGFRCRAGVLFHPKGIEPDALDIAAIEYLIMEWDYGYDVAAR